MSPYKSFVTKTIKNLSVLGLLLAGTIQADYGYECDSCSISRVQFGGSYSHANVKIGGQSSFKGNMGGVQGMYEYKPQNSIYAGLKASWREGKTKNSLADRKLVYVDAHERIGYTFASCCNDWSLTLFSGLGFRHLGHKLTQSDAPSVKFDYNEFYIPVGFLSEYFFCPSLSLGLNYTWMPQFYPTVKIQPLNGARWILKHTMDNMVVELPVTYFLTENNCFSLVVKPFYERWGNGHSTARTSTGQELGLPKNTYIFWGAEFNIAVSF